MPKQKLYGRAAYDPLKAAISDAQLAHKEVVAGLEWFDRGQLQIGVDRLHLAYRFLQDVLVRQKIIEPPPQPVDEVTG